MTVASDGNMVPDDEILDLVVVGGGINGAGIARDASGRGLRVLLCEQDDLGAHTSSASTKLIHGGLRYLEYYEFGLVRKALREREVLLGIAPHIIWPLRFVMPHVRDLRPAWMIRLGLFLYDHIGGRRRLPASSGVDLTRHPAGGVLQPGMHKGFEYSDCWVQDSRLVTLNARDARDHGAVVLPRTRCTGARRGASEWHVRLQDTRTGDEREVRARALVNAAGPWVGRFLGDTGQPARSGDIHLVKGSHIVVPALFEHPYAYLFQHTDGRVIFAIPYEREFTLIGTTDVAHDGNPADAQASPEEIDYLCAAVNRYFSRAISAADVVWTYSGVRALYDEDDAENAAAVSRDYSLDLDTSAAPLLSVYGGKITTYRTLARQTIDRLAPLLGAPVIDWTGSAALPGGDLPDGDFDAWLAHVRERWPWLPGDLAWRLARNYGRDVEAMLADATGIADLGECFGADLYEVEVRHLVEQEWATTAADIVWRRTRLGLVLDAADIDALDRWLAGCLMPAPGQPELHAQSRQPDRPAAEG